MIVIRDSREKLGWTFTRATLVDDIEVKKLDAGDYTIKGYEFDLAVERKRTVGEVAMNLTEKRWPDVLERLSKYKYKFLVCEFSVENIMEFPINSGIPTSRHKYVKVNPPFILACMAAIQIRYGIHIIYAGNTSNAETIVASIFKRIVCRNER